ncbi:MAG: tetratricopeptide repeat protein [Vicinamibacteria bacterium]
MVGDGTASKKGKPGFFVTSGDEEQSPMVPLVFVILTLGVVFAGWRYASQTPAPEFPTSVASVVITPVPVTTPTRAEPGVAEYLAGMDALRAADFPKALRLLRQAVAAANRPDYHLGLAEALEKSGATSDQFIAEYRTAAGMASVNVRYTTEWAKALNRAGRESEAKSAFQQAIDLQPDNLANLREMASLFTRHSDMTGARPYLERIVQLQPDDLTPKQDLARALEAAGDLDGAIRQYQTILTGLPGADVSRALLAEAYMKQNKSEDALRTLNEGLARNSSSALLFREKGRVLDRRGNAQEAVAAYREYVRLAPQASDNRTFVQRIAQLSGQSDS